MIKLRRSTAHGSLQPRSWGRRHKFTTAAVVVVLVVAGLAVWRPWEQCGPGLHPAGSDCVGLNLENTSFGEHDVVKALGDKIVEHNNRVVGPDFVTVVVLDNMTPELGMASIDERNVQHGIEGAITAAARANAVPVASGTTPPVKLLLANYGDGAAGHEAAVREIIAARDREKIIAVTGLGQSLRTTQAAANVLSDHEIAVVSSMASADDMNRDPDGPSEYIRRFYRITPTNVDAASAAASYVHERGQENVMLVRDTNPADTYSSTLATAFQDSYRKKFGHDIASEASYTSTEDPQGTSRSDYMRKMFDTVVVRVCAEKPSLVYFAGRGVDLQPFLQTLSESGKCDRPNVDVLTSDDASNIVSEPLPSLADSRLRVFYTSVATRGEWDGSGQTLNQENYRKFEEAFVQQGFNADADLVDGYAMSTHDAVLVAVNAARDVPSAVLNYKKVGDWIQKTNCDLPFYGATGAIGYDDEPSVQANPVNKAIPIMRLNPRGVPEQVSLIWPSGQPFGPQSCG